MNELAYQESGLQSSAGRLKESSRRQSPKRVSDPLGDYRLTPEQQQESTKRFEEHIVESLDGRIRPELVFVSSPTVEPVGQKTASMTFQRVGRRSGRQPTIMPVPVSAPQLTPTQILGLTSGTYRSPLIYARIATALIAADVFLYFLLRALLPVDLQSLHSAVTVIANIGFIAAALMFLLLTRRFYENLSGFHAAGLCTTSTMAPWWFLIPIGSLWYPHRIYQDMWQASDPYAKGIDPYRWRLTPQSWLVSSWWAACLLLPVFALAEKYGPEASFQLMLLSVTDFVAMSTLAMVMINDLAARQEKKHKVIQRTLSAIGLPPAAKPRTKE